MSSPADNLLYALTWWGSVHWSRFVSAFDELYRDTGVVQEESVQFTRRTAALTLDSLGHCEVHFSRGGGRIAVAPPVLAGLALPGLPRAVLCGARSGSTGEEVRRAASHFGSDLRVEIEPSSSIFGPARIECEADSIEVLRRFASTMGLPYREYPPALSVAAASGSLREYLRLCEWRSGPELNWSRWDFDPRRVRFVEAGQARDDPRLTRYEGGFLGRRYLLWHYDQFAETDPFWGRYAIFSLTERAVLAYDDASLAAYVPRDAPLPRLLARAFALCSGEPGRPTTYQVQGIETSRFLLYSRVPPDVYNAVAQKMMQREFLPSPRRAR